MNPAVFPGIARRALLFAALCVWISPGAGLAQDHAFDGWDLIADPSFRRDPDRQVLRSFRLPEDAEAERLIAAARDKIAKEEYLAAVADLDEVITSFGGKVFQVGWESVRGTKSCARFVGAAELAHFMLSRMPGAGRAVYDEFARRRAGEDLEEAEARRDTGTIGRIAVTYAASSTGAAARLFLADYHSERGEAGLAALWLRKSLLFEPRPSRPVLLRLARALDQGGREAEAAALLEESGGEEKGAEDFVRALEESPPLVPPPRFDWPTMGGAPSRNRAMPFRAGAGFAPARWSADTFNETLRGENPFLEDGDGPVPFRLVREGDMLVVNDSVSVRAFSVYTGELLWRFRGPLEQAEGRYDLFNLSDYTSFARQPATVAREIVAGATAAGDVLFVNLQAARPRRKKKYLYRDVINKPIPVRHLFALSAADGSLLWEQGGSDPDPESFMNRLSVSAPPVVVGNRVFCNGHLIEGGVRTFLLCFEKETGALIWKTALGVGQQALTMFNMSFREFVDSPLTLRGGTLFLCSNLGFMAAVDALSGRIRWCTEYESTPLPRSNDYTNPPPRHIFWYNAPPLASAAVVTATPLDARLAAAFDSRTGRMLWVFDALRLCRTDCRYLLGLRGGKVLLGGSGGALALDLSTGRMVWRTEAFVDWEPCAGRGARSDGKIFLCLEDKVAAVDAETGKIVAESSLGGKVSGASSLFLFGDVTARVGPGSLEVSFDAEKMLGEALSRLAPSPPAGKGKGGAAASAASGAAAGKAAPVPGKERGGGSFEDLAFIGDMYRLKGDRGNAVSFYRRALEAAKDARPRSLARVRSGLFGVLFEKGLAAQKSGAAGRAAEAFAAARDCAPGPVEAVRAAAELAMIDLEGKDWKGLEAVLDDLAGPRRDTTFDARGRLGLGLCRAGFFAAVARCRAAGERGDPEALLAALRLVLERYSGDVFGKEAGSVKGWDWAASRIAALIEKEGRRIYASLEARAEEAFRAASASRNADLLGAVAFLYPNAGVAPRAVLEQARILIDKGASAEAYRALLHMISRPEPGGMRPHALFLMARAAEKEGNAALAAAIDRRVRLRYGSVTSLWEENTTLGRLATRIPAARPSPAPPPPLPRPPFTEAEWTLESPAASVVALHGRIDSPGSDPYRNGVLLNLATPARLLLFDVTAAKPAWQASLDRVDPGEARYALAAGPVLAVCFDKDLLGLDGASGRVVWRRSLEDWIVDVHSLEGLLVIVHVPPEEGDGTMMTAEAIDPVTGNTLWKRGIEECRDLQIVRSQEVFAFVAGGREVRILDVVTGEDVGKAAFDFRSVTAFPFPSPPGRLVVRVRGEKGRSALLALDSSTGKEAWRFTVGSGRIAYGDTVRCPGGILTAAGDAGADGFQKNLFLLNAATGKIKRSIRLAPSDALFPGDFFLGTTCVFFHPLRVTRNFGVSAVEADSGVWRFEDVRLDLFGGGGRLPGVQEGVYAADGLIVAVNYVPARRTAALRGRVFFVDGGTGEVTLTKDILSSERAERIFRFRQSIQTALCEGGVLVLSGNRVVVIGGAR